MVADNTLELLYYKVIRRRRGHGFGALTQVIGRTIFPIFRKYVIPAAKRVGVDFSEFAVPQVANAMGGKKNFESAAKSVRSQTLRKQLGGFQKSISPQSLN